MRPSPSCIRTPNVCLGYSMDGHQLRRLVNKAAKAYADQYRLPHYLSCNQTEPTVLFFADQDPRLHGNFLNASYDVICGNPEWERRLRKPHPRKGSPAGGTSHRSDGVGLMH